MTYVPPVLRMPAPKPRGLPPIAAVADTSLDKLTEVANKQIEDFTGVNTAFFFTTLGMIAGAWSISHEDIFLDKYMSLAKLSINVKPSDFFLIAPVFYLLFYWYVLCRLQLVASVIRSLRSGMTNATPHEKDLAKSSLIPGKTLAFLATGTLVEKGGVDRLARLLAVLTLGVLPLLAIVLLLLCALPMQDEKNLWTARAAFVLAGTTFAAVYVDVLRQRQPPQAPALGGGSPEACCCSDIWRLPSCSTSPRRRRPPSPAWTPYAPGRGCRAIPDHASGPSSGSVSVAARGGDRLG